MLPVEVQQAIEKVLKAGNTAKVSVDRHGKYHVQEEKLKKVPLEAPAAVNSRL